MTDVVGNLTLPASATDNPPGDPVLDPLLKFFKQALANNLGPVWATMSPNVPVVKFSDTRNVTEDALSTTELPGLYLYRDNVKAIQWFAHDYMIVPSQLVLQWVLPNLQLKWRRQRNNLFNAASMALQMPLEQWGRAPGLVFAGDTDPLAATKGSLIFSFARFISLDFVKSDLSKFEVDLEREGKRLFDCVTWTFNIRERMDVDEAADYPILDGVDGTLATSGFTVDTLRTGIRLSAISPATGTAAGGTAITLTGVGMAPLCTVTIGSAPCTSIVVSSDLMNVDAVTPAGTVGARDVKLTNPSGETATLAGAFTYT